MIPEIQTIAKTEEEFTLLLELAKSARTRNLIGTVLTKDCDVMTRTRSLLDKEKDPSRKKKIQHALLRWEKQKRKKA